MVTDFSLSMVIDSSESHINGRKERTKSRNKNNPINPDVQV
jgi:hypothetical protein